MRIIMSVYPRETSPHIRTVPARRSQRHGRRAVVGEGKTIADGGGRRSVDLERLQSRDGAFAVHFESDTVADRLAESFGREAAPARARTSHLAETRSIRR